jgi:capsular polysaccharide biosynthesis protein/Mrp family chromosome partitioning ATPase
MESDNLFTSTKITFDLKDLLRIGHFWLLPILVVTIVMSLVFYFGGRSIKPVYKATTVIMVSTVSSTGVENYDSVVTGERLALTYSQIMNSNEFVGNVVSKADNKSVTFEKLRSALTVSQVRDTQLIDITVEYDDPELAAKLANTVAGVIIEQVKSNSIIEANLTRQSLKTRIDQLNLQINNLKIEIKQKIDNSNNQKLKIIKEEIFTLAQDIRQLNENLVALKYDNPVVTSIDENKKQIIATATPSLEKQKSLADETAQLAEKQNLLSKYQEQLVLLTTNQDLINSSDPEISQDLYVINQLEQIYLTSVQSYEANSYSNQQNQQNIVQVYKAQTPQKPAGMPALLFAILGALVGLLVSIVAIFGFEIFDPHVKSVDFFPNKYTLPLLAVMNKTKVPYEKIIQKIQDYPEILETCHLLQLKINEKADNRTILFTSPTPWDEGDSLATFLAITIAGSGSKVLLMDASTSSSIITSIAGQRKGKDYLPTDHKNFEEDNSYTTNFSNLSIVFLHYFLLGNQQAIFSLEMARDLINEFLVHYDFIFIYAPTASSPVCAFLFSTIANSTILVVKPEKSSVNSIDQAIQRLKQRKANILGVVLNNISSRRFISYFKNNTNNYHNHATKMRHPL